MTVVANNAGDAENKLDRNDAGIEKEEPRKLAGGRDNSRE
jgi:hypothetical protein